MILRQPAAPVHGSVCNHIPCGGQNGVRVNMGAACLEPEERAPRYLVVSITLFLSLSLVFLSLSRMRKVLDTALANVPEAGND